MSLRDGLVCYAEFVGKTLLAVPFLLPQPNSFLRLCLPTFCAFVVRFFRAQTTSAISGVATSQHLRFLQLGGCIYAKIELRYYHLLVQVHQMSVHVVDQCLFRNEPLFVLKQLYCKVFQIRNEYRRLSWTSKSKQGEWYRRMHRIFFHRSCVSNQCE